MVKVEKVFRGGFSFKALAVVVTGPLASDFGTVFATGFVLTAFVFMLFCQKFFVSAQKYKK